MNLKFWKKGEKPEVIRDSFKQHYVSLMTIEALLSSPDISEEQRLNLRLAKTQEQQAAVEALALVVRKGMRKAMVVGVVIVILGAASYFIVNSDESEEDESQDEDPVYLPDEALVVEDPS